MMEVSMLAGCNKTGDRLLFWMMNQQGEPTLFELDERPDKDMKLCRERWSIEKKVKKVKLGKQNVLRVLSDQHSNLKSFGRECKDHHALQFFNAQV